MPLVTIKYKPSVASDEDINDLCVIAEEFQAYFSRNCKQLGLGESLGIDATQVELVPFGTTYGAPDIWVCVQFTESPSNARAAAGGDLIVVRDQIWQWLQRLLHQSSEAGEANFSYALDLFWGPGYGHISLWDENSRSRKIISW